MSNIIVSGFYHFIEIKNCEELRETLLAYCKSHHLKGTILIAPEGINLSMSASKEDIYSFYYYLCDLLGLDFSSLAIKDNLSPKQPFMRMKVRLKREIVAFGVAGLDMEKRGDYIEPKDWDEFISRDDTILIDTRNSYEVALGTFEGAVDPATRTFRQFPEWTEQNMELLKGKKVAMFCTGGVRCEKSTAYLKQLGIDEVYHLKGGILQYLEETNNQNNKWQGDCFVFDDRIAVDTSLTPIKEMNCFTCDAVITTDDIKDVNGKEVGYCLKCLPAYRASRGYSVKADDNCAK
jgi:UPF0176 protein